MGEFFVLRILSASPAKLWRLASSHAGISRRYFDDYFSERAEAHAFEIGEVRRYEEPLDPRKMSRGFRAPQSFVYLGTLKGFERRLSEVA